MTQLRVVLAGAMGRGGAWPSMAGRGVEGRISFYIGHIYNPVPASYTCPKHGSNHVPVHIHAHNHGYAHAYTRVYTHVYTRLCTCLYICVCSCVCTRLYTSLGARRYTCLYTCLYTSGVYPVSTKLTPKTEMVIVPQCGLNRGNGLVDMLTYRHEYRRLYRHVY